MEAVGKIIGIVLALLIVLGIPYLIFRFIKKAAKNSKKWVDEKEQKHQEKITSNENLFNSLGIEKRLGNVNYETGHPEMLSPVSKNNFEIGFSKDNLYLLEVEKGLIIKNEFIPFAKIKNVTAQDVSYFKKKTSVTDTLLYGHGGAKLMRDDVKVEKHYVVVDWEDGKFTHSTIFSYEGKDSIALSNELRSTIIKYSNK